MDKTGSASAFMSDDVENQRKEIERLADELHDSLVVNVKREMKESIFVGYFLPRILGEIVDKDNRWISDWHGAVMSLAVPVQVVHDVTGEKLFVVPPLLQTSKLGTREGSGTLQDIVKEYMMRKENPMARSKEFIASKLSETYNDLTADGIDLQTEIGQWEYILKKYGRIKTEGEVNNSQPVDDEDDITDLLEY